MPPLLSRRLVLPPLCVRVPTAFGEEPVDVRKGAVAADEEAEPFAVGLARPFAGPRLAARVTSIEADTAERLSAAVRASLYVASIVVLLTDACAAVGTAVVIICWT